MKRIFLLLGCCMLAIAGMGQSVQGKGNIALVIHGGAGTILKKNLTDEQEKQYKAKLAEALNAGYKVLDEGGTCTDAVITAITILEDSPLFNAGKGAVFTNEGKNELDASIMTGKDKNAGSVAGVTTVKNPIKAAYEVMDNSVHVMMSGPGAEQFAAEQGLEIVEPEYFFNERRFNQLQRIKDIKQKPADKVRPQGALPGTNDYKYGTVGAVALDRNGNIAAGTSTGGMTNKRYGRIGDAPIIGAGTYADNESCGVSATGHGEYFMRWVVAYDIAALMKYGNKTLHEAANEVINEKLLPNGGRGGIIALDKQGNITMTFNTEGMYRGYINKKNKPEVFIYKD